jgi:hypothetical protein
MFGAYRRAGCGDWLHANHRRALICIGDQHAVSFSST